MTYRLMCDSDQLAALIDTPLIATYADLITTGAELASLQAAHPGSEIILIDRALGDPLGLASVRDVEAHADAIAGTPAWIRGKHAAGVAYVTVYASASLWPQLDTACAGLGFWRWIADWGSFTDTAHPGATIQFADAAMVRIHDDLSVVKADGWHPTPGSPAWLTGVLASLHSAASGISSAIVALQAHGA